MTRLTWTLVVGYAAVVIVALATVVVPELRDAEEPEAPDTTGTADPVEP